jgi:hypothetical protein
MKHHLIRLDRVAGELNAWLLAIAIGLGMLDLTVLAVKCIPALPRTPAIVGTDDPGQIAAPSPSPNTHDIRS